VNIAERSKLGLAGDYQAALGNDLRSLAYDAEREWLVVLAKKPDSGLRFLLSAQGEATGADLNSKRLLEVLAREGYGEEKDEFLALHNHSLASWEALMLGAEDKEWRATYGIGDPSPQDIQDQMAYMREGKIPPLRLPPSVADVVDFLGRMVATEGYRATMKGAVADPAGVWEFSFEPGLSKDDPGSGLYRMMLKMAEDKSMPPELRRKCETAIDQYQRSHARIIAPYSARAVAQALRGDRSLIQREMEARDKALERLKRAAAMLQVTVEFRPYPPPEAPPEPPILVAAR
jgi:hypothetical protein